MKASGHSNKCGALAALALAALALLLTFSMLQLAPRAGLSPEQGGILEPLCQAVNTCARTQARAAED